jgi:opacity protein-like surface antigen
MKIRYLLAVGAVLVSAPRADAQVSSPVKFTVFAGAVIPTGEGSDEVNTGYTVGLSVDAKVPTTMFGVRAEALYAKFEAKESAVGFDGNLSDFGINANGVVWFPMASVLGGAPFLTAGPSFSRMRFEVQSNNTSISESENHWGFNAGGGIEFNLGTMGARVDVRYKQISTDGDSYKSIPITFGIRF